LGAARRWLEMTAPGSPRSRPADDEADNGLAGAVARAFAAGGPLARADAGYVERDVQQRFAAAVAAALDQRGALVAEAGTGVGKTFAYLVPLLLSGRRALVSTATKSLQDQLYLRDLPRLVAALGVPVQLALLKGRASYLCLHRLEQARQGGGDEVPFGVQHGEFFVVFASAAVLHGEGVGALGEGVACLGHGFEAAGCNKLCG